MGLLGVIYLVGRASGKFVGARAAARRLGLDRSIQQFLGLALLAQAGLAIGLTLSINSRVPDQAGIVSTVVFAAVALSDVIGPVSARIALVRAGEAGRAQPTADTILSASPTA